MVFRRHNRRPRSIRCVPFTLVEVLVAMAVLAVIMLMLMKLLQGAQGAMSVTETNTRIYENARIAFELIGRDLQSALASDMTEHQIPFYVGDQDDAIDPPDVFVAMVTTDIPPSTAKSEICEVSYTLQTHSGAGDNRYWLRVKRVYDSSDDWDFYGKTESDPGAPDEWWVNTGAGSSWKRVISGVEEFELEFYDRDMTVLIPGRTHNELPAMARITLTLFDPMAAKRDLPEAVRDRTKRTFTKLFFLDREPR